MSSEMSLSVIISFIHGFTAICIAPDSDNVCAFADPFLLQNYPEIGFVRCFLRFRWRDWFPIVTCSPAICPFPLRLNVFLLLQRFRFFLIRSGFNFLAFRLADYVSVIHLYFLNIAINPVLIQFIYSRLFYSVVVLPKNKIRSIINSFEYYILNSATFNFFVLLAWVLVTF